MYNLVLVTSAINTSTNPLSYTNTRSAFTHEERFKQSLITIESIKQYIPNPYIVFIEGTIINDEYKNTIINSVNYLHKAYEDPSVLAEVNGLYKGYAENKKILSYLNSDNFITNKHLFTSLTKISGRYYINNNFTFSIYDNSVTGNIRFDNNAHHSGIWMSTLFYSFHSKLIDKYVNVVNSADSDNEFKDGVALEHIFPKHILLNNINIHNTPTLNVEGCYGPWGSFIKQ